MGPGVAVWPCRGTWGEVVEMVCYCYVTHDNFVAFLSLPLDFPHFSKAFLGKQRSFFLWRVVVSFAFFGFCGTCFDDGAVMMLGGGEKRRRGGGPGGGGGGGTGAK